MKHCHQISSTAWKEITTNWTAAKITIPRKILTGSKSTPTFEIHVFTDSSKSGYCAVVYLIEITSKRTSTLLIFKIRLSPLKSTLTIPRPELSTIALGAKLLKHICLNVDITIEQIFIWSDSNVALTWTKSKNSLPLFIRKRIKSIKENAADAILRFVPGDSNPADVGSRGLAIQNLILYDAWWTGADFLLQTHAHSWPTDISSKNVSSENDQINCHAKRTHRCNQLHNFYFSQNGSAAGNDYSVWFFIFFCSW
ncbi:hypothetical protein NECAME_19060 [Necator americanus]|uniref:Pao retrotransposon peptidase n=1 Tax=Necator americanus TaxID=51031 RepID=W2STI2_NECAM|nr:hypothetical protein NECAME_19060 [Necator americanus]ETN72012.1 hypothetical protein NECAME_19060 [Necator americanus]